ncbi:hypothetical protein O181_028254 [Austropuccinia psidii MF-1]|uniref:Uncharacterized protein n=1 Tax=Austropuccinia psidii MF-1 TaxID=1389203 RepID=A0A9Q3CQC8_9BASI|nr:hypothetical protein [Austropuccinia psidii MF-1]
MQYTHMISSFHSLIQPLSSFLEYLSIPIHPIYLPISLLPFLHAARISIAYRSLNSQAGGETTVMANLAGFLLMAWGGSIWSHLFLSLPIPQMLSFKPLLAYGITHLIIPDISRLPTLKTLDSFLPLIDALIRTTAIAAGVEACRTHPVSAVSESWAIQLFIGAISSSGGGISAQALRVWEPNWCLARPSFLQEGTMLAGTDVWSGALIAAIYGALTASHPSYHHFLSKYFPYISPKPILPTVDAKALSAFILAVIYCWRTYQVHYISKPKNKKIALSFKRVASNSKSKKE